MMLTWLLNFKAELETTIAAITIVGISESGKTALAKLALFDPIVQKHFQFKKWVCIVDNFSSFNAISIAAKIVRCNNNDDMELMLKKLKHKTYGLRCLIVLDDVWSESRQGWDQLMKMTRSIVIKPFVFSTKYVIQT
jgi:uridine kinase